jgi:hypothetical protein
MDKFYGKIVSNFVMDRSIINEHLCKFELHNDVFGRYLLSYKCEGWFDTLYMLKYQLSLSYFRKPPHPPEYGKMLVTNNKLFLEELAFRFRIVSWSSQNNLFEAHVGVKCLNV